MRPVLVPNLKKLHIINIEQSETLKWRIGFMIFVIVKKLDSFYGSVFREYMCGRQSRYFEVRFFTVAHDPIKFWPSRSILNSDPIGVLIHWVF